VIVMTPVLEAMNLTKTYAQGEAAMRALDEVSLDLHAGELALLVGPSGSGKTTLLSIMGCILRPTAGTLRVMGDEVSRLGERDLPAIRRERIGFIFQAFNLFPTLTAWQNVALALDLKGVSGRAARDRAEARSSASRLRARWPAILPSSWPTSRPRRSIPRADGR
jgi:putative ABC transport system ATP-binding protein